MAARLNRRHQDSIRQKIQANRLVEELTKFVDGKREMTSTQLRAVEILLNKSIPNLQSVTHDVEEASPLAQVLADIKDAGLPKPVDERRTEVH